MSSREKGLSPSCFLAVLLGISLLSAPPYSLGQQNPKAPRPRVELVIHGPKSFSKGTVPFIATLINRSKIPLTLVPPKQDWYDEFWAIWSVSDPNGRELSHEPKSFVWCDGLAFHAQTIPEPGVFLSQKPKLIQESDLVTLQPGEKLEFCGLGNPAQFFRMKQPGEYKVTLQYKFDPSHYVLPSGSPKSAALKTALPLDLASNTLTVRLEPLEPEAVT
jgi:hypothetical protein